MTVTTTAFTAGGNSKKIAIANELGNGSTNIIAAIDSAIKALGWINWDTISITTYNPIATYVYQSPNFDKLTYKYFILRWDTAKLQFYTSTCEYWYNNYRHQPVNESWSNAGAFAQGYDLVNSFIIVAGTARNLMMWNNINNNPGMWTGVFEMERVAPDDVPSNPFVGSLYFNGSSAVNVTPTSYAFGLNDFTIETWVYPTVASQGCNLIDFRPLATNGPYINISLSGSGNAPLFYVNGATQITGSALTTNAWTHIAVSRVGGNTCLFINGVQSGSTYADSNSYAIASTIGVGVGTFASSGYYTGYLTNLRFSKQGLYTTTFVVPGRPLLATPTTTLLLATAPQLPFNDSSSLNTTVTNGGTAYNALSPFQPGSVAINSGSLTFNGSLQYLYTPTNAAWQFGSGNFTVECWAYIRAFGTQGVALGGPWGASGGTNRSWLFAITNPSSLAFNYSTNGTNTFFSGSLTTRIPLNTWNHYAAVRNGNILTVYLNGIAINNNINNDVTGVTINPGTTNLNIGYNSENAASPGVYDLNGYICDFRIVKGTAVYTTNFKPPTQPLTTIANTVLLLNTVTGANAFVDSSTNNFSLTNNNGVTANVYNPYNGSNYQTVSNLTIASVNTSLGSNASIYTSGIQANSAAPCYAWTNSVMIGTPYGLATAQAGRSTQMFAFPRTADGNVGVAATTTYAPSTVRGPMPPMQANANIAITGDSNYLHLGSFQSTTTQSLPVANTGSLFYGNTLNQPNWLTVTPGTAFNANIANMPLTVEAWVFLTQPGGCIVSGVYPGSGAIPICLSLNTSGSVITNPDTSGYYPHFSYYNGSSWSGIASNTAIVANTWTHVAGVFTGSTARIYINGTVTGSGGPTTWGTTASQGLYIGRRWDTAGTYNYMSGYIDQVRIVRGTAVYTNNFTTPTAPLAATQTANSNGNPSLAISGNTQLLLTANTQVYYLTDSSGNIGINSVTVGGGSVSWSAYSQYSYNTMIDSIPYGWDTSKTIISPISVVAGTAQVGNANTTANTYSMSFGRMYGTGVGRGVGNISIPDTTLANINSTYGWPSSSDGQIQNTEVLLLPMNGGNESGLNTYGPSLFSNVFANIGSSMIPTKAVAVGNNLFVAANTSTLGGTQGGIFTVNLAASTYSTPIFQSNISFGVFDLIFDGNNYIWGSTANGIVRMDAQTFTTTFYTSVATVANGVGYLAMDNHNIYCSSRVPSTKPQVYVFDRVQNTFNGTIDTTTAFTNASTWGTPVPDYSGNVYLFQTAGTTSATSMYGQLNSNAASYATVNSTTSPGGGAVNYGHTPWYDSVSQRLWEIVPNPAGSGINTAELFPSNLITRNSAVNFPTAQATTTYYQTTLTPTSGTPDYRGDAAWIVPMRGHLIAGPRKPGQVSSMSAGTVWQSIFDPMSYNYNNANPGGAYNIYSSSGSTTPLYPTAGSGGTTTNTVQLYSVWGPGTTPANDNRVYVVNGIYTANTVQGANVGRIIIQG